MTPFSETIHQQGLVPQEEMLELQKKKNKLNIGIPKEQDPTECRIALTPQSVNLLVEEGHQVMVERGAGVGSNYSDRHYAESGAQIVDTADEVFKSDIILKIAPVSVKEVSYLKRNQAIISALHAASQNKEILQALMEKRITAIAYELLKDENHYPVVCSMSEISGIAAIMVASELLSNAQGGKGVLLGGVTGISPTDVVILGAGTAAEYAARAAIGLGARVQVFDHSMPQLRRLQHHLDNKVSTSILQHFALRKSFATADVVIGALEGKSDQTFCVTEDVIQSMKKGSILIDLNVDNYPTFVTSRMTTMDNPTFVKHGVIHYCVPNIASRTARTASIALSNIFAPLLIQIADSGGLNQEIKENTSLRNGIYLYNGILTNEKLASTFGLMWRDINLLIAVY